MQSIEVDLSLVGMRIVGQDVQVEEVHELTDDQRVYIFSNDILHLVVDSSGGFSAYRPYESDEEKEIEPFLQGHLIDYCGKTH